MADRTNGSERVSRRGFLANAGKIAAAAGVGAVGLSGLASAQTSQPTSVPYPWPYKKVDPEKVYWNGVAEYPKYGCAQASFDAIIREMGEPFTAVPSSIMRWGEGGGVGMGSHCGALLGSSSAISLAFGGDPDTSSKMIKELTAWYMQELGSGSQLCHVSVTEWSKANGVAVESQERKDRCGRVSGETAKKAALLMNAQASGELKVAFPTTNPASITCVTCHGNDGQKAVRNGVALQDCTSCHDTAHKQ